MKAYRCHIVLFLLLDCATQVFSQLIDFDIQGKVDILIVDPSGRRYGRDRTTGNTYREIPNVGIGSAMIGTLNPVTGKTSVDSAMLDLVDGSIYPPLNGMYQFILQGKANCITYVSPIMNFSNGDGVNNGAIGSIIDSNMTVTINLFFIDNNSGQTFLKKQIDQQYLIKSLNAMRNANWIFSEPTLKKYVSLVDTFYGFVAHNSIVPARLTLSNVLQDLQVDSLSHAIDKKVLVYLSKDINQLIFDLPPTQAK